MTTGPRSRGGGNFKEQILSFGVGLGLKNYISAPVIVFEPCLVSDCTGIRVRVPKGLLLGEKIQQLISQNLKLLTAMTTITV